MKAKVYATKKVSFESAHHLNNYEGKCSRVHGHSYKLEATVSGVINVDTLETEPATEAMVLDFSCLKKILNDNIVEVFDHTDLNEIFEQPTAEVMAVSFYTILSMNLSKDITLESVKLWETEDSFAEYRGEIV